MLIIASHGRSKFFFIHASIKEARICRRNLSAIGENVWYLFQMRNSLVSSLGVRGRNVSPLASDVSTKRSNVSR